jgi:hypothetical protein
MRRRTTLSNFSLSLITYMKGVAKGFGLLAIYFIANCIYALILMRINNLPIEELRKVLDYRYSIVAWLSGLCIIYYLVHKHKLMKGWLLIGALFTVYLLPLIMGSIELQKLKAQKPIS